MYSKSGFFSSSNVLTRMNCIGVIFAKLISQYFTILQFYFVLAEKGGGSKGKWDIPN